jgi:hypothetical protein
MAVIKDDQVARKILDHLGLPSIIPEVGRVHEAPHWNFVPLRESELWPTGPPSDEHGQAPAWDEYDQRLATSDRSD